MPYIRLTFTSMATGADHCQHHFELLDKTSKKTIDSEQYLRQPADPQPAI